MLGETQRRLIQNDIIEKVDHPTTKLNLLVPVIKPTSSKLRLCLDMRHVNEAIVRERHVMPKIKDILTEPHQPKAFSKISLGEGYH